MLLSASIRTLLFFPSDLISDHTEKCCKNFFNFSIVNIEVLQSIFAIEF